MRECQPESLTANTFAERELEDVLEGLCDDPKQVMYEITLAKFVCLPLLPSLWFNFTGPPLQAHRLTTKPC